MVVLPAGFFRPPQPLEHVDCERDEKAICMPEAEQAEAPMDLLKEIGGALPSIRARYVGARPVSAETEVDGNVVRWILAGGDGEFEKGMASEDEDAKPDPP